MSPRVSVEREALERVIKRFHFDPEAGPLENNGCLECGAKWGYGIAECEYHVAGCELGILRAALAGAEAPGGGALPRWEADGIKVSITHATVLRNALKMLSENQYIADQTRYAEEAAALTVLLDAPPQPQPAAEAGAGEVERLRELEGLVLEWARARTALLRGNDASNAPQFRLHDAEMAMIHYCRRAALAPTLEQEA